MDIAKVRNVFTALTGIKNYHRETHEPVIEAALDKVFCALKPGVPFTSTNSALVYAIAAEAYYQYTLTQIAKERDGAVRTGDISVQADTAKTMNNAKNIRDELLCMAKDFLKLDDSFYFKGVV